MFGASSGPKDRLHSAEEAEAALRRYAADSGLARAHDAPQLRLDRLLIASLYNKSEQPGGCHANIAYGMLVFAAC